MSGTKQSWDYESLKKVFKQKGWNKTHRIKPNRPYNKGVEVRTIGDPTRGILPHITQQYDKNWELGVEMIKPGYHPDNKQPAISDGFFSQEAMGNTISNKQRLYLCKWIDILEDAEEALPGFGLKLDPVILSTLRKIKNKLNK